MKIVVNNESKKRKNPIRKSMAHDELMNKIESTGGTHLDREQVVIQNLKGMGF